MIDTTEIKIRLQKRYRINENVRSALNNTDSTAMIQDMYALLLSHDELKQELSKYADCIDGQWIPYTIEGSND